MGDLKRIILFAALAMMLTACNKKNETMSDNNSKTTLECIMTRTSIRQYTAQPVEEEKIEAMLRAGMAAPTAVNAQPWHFVVVSDQAKLRELAAANPRAKML